MPLRHDRSGGTRTARPPTPISTERTSHYTELEGGSGRDIYFRPERYLRSELGSVGVAVLVSFEGLTHRCELEDVSQNGFAFGWVEDTTPPLGAVLDEVVLRFDGHEAYRGRARVCSSRPSDRGTLVGASLMDTLMNIADVLQLRDVKATIGDPEFPFLRLESGAWRVPGQERFKALVAELCLFLEDARAKFGELEASLPWHVVHGEQQSPARDALIERIQAGFVTDLVSASNSIDAALRSAPAEARSALREFSERYLGDLLMQSPWMYRARHKPLGYPGDFEVMNGLYGRHFSGASLFAKALNLGFVSTPAAEAVRRRKDMIKSRLSAALDAREARGEPCRLLSVAAGPAEEVLGLLEERQSIGVPLEVVLFDQDKAALSFSFARLNRVVSQRWPGKVKIVHLHDSITKLLRGSTVLSTSGQFDAVYASGLFDYLQPHTWVSLCRSLYGMLAPSGTLYVGNMVPSSPSRWFMELHLDWFLEYRQPEELLRLARKAAPDAQRIALLEEVTLVNPFVALTRA
jgi:extracellular factor (EF) 3-hydroxypalmitic acid methyl ester biosynthesis protein